jgi:hypothetical protein
VLEAFNETRREFIAFKVGAAQRAISVRLRDKSPADLDEQIAIRNALQSLSVLMPEPERAKSNKDKEKKETA